jgi:hypothetical protein
MVRDARRRAPHHEGLRPTAPDSDRHPDEVPALLRGPRRMVTSSCMLASSRLASLAPPATSAVALTRGCRRTSALVRISDSSRGITALPKSTHKRKSRTFERRSMTDCSGRCDEGGHRDVHRIYKAGRLIRQPDLALQLLAQRPHETRAKALSGRSMYRRATFFRPY